MTSDRELNPAKADTSVTESNAIHIASTMMKIHPCELRNSELNKITMSTAMEIMVMQTITAWKETHPKNVRRWTALTKKITGKTC